MDVTKTTHRSSGSSEPPKSAGASYSQGEINRTPPDELVKSSTRDTATTQPTSSCNDGFNTSEFQAAQPQERSQLHTSESTTISDHDQKPTLSAATSPLSDSGVNSQIETTEYVGDFDAGREPVHTTSKPVNEGMSQEPEVTHQSHPLNREHSHKQTATSASNVQHSQPPELRGYRPFHSISPPPQIVALQNKGQLDVFVRFLLQRAPTRQVPEISFTRHSPRLQEGFDYITITRRPSGKGARRFDSHVPYLNYPYDPSRDLFTGSEVRLNLRTTQLVRQTRIRSLGTCEIGGEPPMVHKYVRMGSEAKHWFLRTRRDPVPDFFEVPDLMPDPSGESDDEVSQGPPSTANNRRSHPRLRGGHLDDEFLDTLDHALPTILQIERLNPSQIGSRLNTISPRDNNELQEYRRALFLLSFLNLRLSEDDSTLKNTWTHQRKMRLFADEVEKATKNRTLIAYTPRTHRDS